MLIRNRKKLFSEAAEKNHTHTDYKYKADFAVITRSDMILSGVGGITTLAYPSGFNRDNCAVISIGFCPSSAVGGGGYRGDVVTFQNHEYLMHSLLAKESIWFGYISIGGTGSDTDEYKGTIRIVLMKL